MFIIVILALEGVYFFRLAECRLMQCNPEA